MGLLRFRTTKVKKWVVSGHATKTVFFRQLDHHWLLSFQQELPNNRAFHVCSGPKGLMF